jgi:hypothetical protein
MSFIHTQLGYYYVGITHNLVTHILLVTRSKAKALNYHQLVSTILSDGHMVLN